MEARKKNAKEKTMHAILCFFDNNNDNINNNNVAISEFQMILYMCISGTFTLPFLFLSRKGETISIA